ncbi:hypothetical protein [Kitasatospora sp. NPDC057198]|uniref:hypothetical protein n=1 Tax=Kitasatospora sp. NPDC057198 TaxID=3346046 RepID=UPI003630A288
MGTYDPTYLLKDAVKSVSRTAEALAGGQAAWDRPRDISKSLELLRDLVGDLSQVLLQQAGALPRMTGDSGAPAAGRHIAEAAAIAAQLGNQLRRAHDATDGVR